MQVRNVRLFCNRLAPNNRVVWLLLPFCYMRHSLAQASTSKFAPRMSTTDLVVSEESMTTEVWPEPFNTPGIIPRHLTHAAAASAPLLEVLQRILYRSSPHGVADLGKALALLGLYQAVRPVYTHLRDLLLWAFTVEVTISENDSVAKEVLAWIGAMLYRRAILVVLCW